MDTKNTTNPQGDTSDISYQVMPRAGAPLNSNPEPAPAPKQASPPLQPAQPPVAPELDHVTPPSIWHNRWLYIILGAVLLLIIGGAIYLMTRGGDSDNGEPSPNQQTTTRLPKVWLQQYFNKEVCDDELICGDDADPDSDGLSNYEEFRMGTSPINSDHDGDGLADGDEVYVYKTDPTLKFTDRREVVQANNWTDGFQISNGYDPLTPALPFTETRLQQIANDIQKHPLNEPTLTTLNVNPDGTPVSTSGTEEEISDTAAKNVAVTIEANALNPSEITINVGDTVVWLNKDEVVRMIASDPHPNHTALPELVSRELGANQTYSFKFTKVGTWGYHDHNNPTLKGTVIVK